MRKQLRRGAIRGGNCVHAGPRQRTSGRALVRPGQPTEAINGRPHRGQPHGDIPPTGRTARWSAAAIFQVKDGKLHEFIKDWNKLSMWEQLGWPASECFTHQ